jgi:hypothetical protein
MQRVTVCPNPRPGLGRGLSTTFASVALLAQFQLSAQISVPANGLIAYFPGNDTAQDLSPNHNDGSFSGPYVAGKVGDAFDVTVNKVTIPNIPAYRITGDLSVDFWFKGLSAGSVFLGIDNGGGATDKWVVLYAYNTADTFQFHVNGPSTAFLNSDPVVPDASQWNNLAVVKAGDEYSFYLNGAPIGSQTFGGAFPHPTAPLTLGSAEGLTYSGLLDEIVLYNRALSPAEVGQLAGVAAVPEPAASGAAICLALGAFGLLIRRSQKR